MNKLDLQEVQREARLAANKVIKDCRAQHPELSNIQASIDIRLYPKKPKGYYQLPRKVVEYFILSPAAVSKTNRELAIWINEIYLEGRVTESFFCKPLNQPTLSSIKALLAREGLSVDIKATDSLSKIKRRWAASLKPPKSRSTTIRVTFSDDHVRIGDATYTIDRSTPYPRIRKDKSWVRADVLERLLGDTD